MHPFFGTRDVQETFCDRLCSKTCISLVVAFIFLAGVCYGRPAVGNQSVIAESVVFLSRYGYLPSSGTQSESLRTEAQLRRALSSMQEFGGLPRTGVADEATVRLMRRRRCGLPDIPPGQQQRHRLRRYAIQGQRWPGTTLSWSVRSVAPSDERMVRAQLRRAFRVWSDSSPLEFVEAGPDAGSADILVSFLRGRHGDGYPFDGEGAVLAHAFFPGEGIGGDAHFDAEERWLPNQPDSEEEGVNLFAVAAHEIGHSLGLSHSSTPGSLMFPYYQVMGEHFSLPQDDADGIRYLYGVKEPDKQSTMPSLPPTTTPQSTTAQTRSSTPVTATEVSWVPQTTKKPDLPPPQDIPDVCNTSIDAISVIRREVFVFKGRYFWRLDKNHTLRAGYPVSIDRFWYDLPANLTHVDAVYERPTDTKIVFFVGRYFWLFAANQLESGYPRPLTDLGLPEDLDRVDAAMVWGHNGKTYLFAGQQYWKFDEIEGRVELDYPRNIQAWRGLPDGVDAALLWTDGNTYFFRGTKFWRFVDVKMRVESKPASEIGHFWFKCHSQKMETTQPVTTHKPVILQSDIEFNAAIFVKSSLYVVIVALLACSLLHIDIDER